MDTDEGSSFVEISTHELERLRQIETAARTVMEEWRGRRSSTPLLSAMAELRAALKEEHPDEGSAADRP